MGAIAAFLQQKKVCQVTWYLTNEDPARPHEAVISSGSIRKERYGAAGNGTGMIMENDGAGAGQNQSQNASA